MQLIEYDKVFCTSSSTFFKPLQLGFYLDVCYIYCVQWETSLVIVFGLD